MEELPVLPEWRFDHIGISVADLSAAVDFCRRYFAASVVFTLDSPPPGQPSGAERLGASADTAFGLAMLQIGGMRVELLQWYADDERSQQQAITQAGSHLALEVTDVATAAVTLRTDREVEVLGEPITFRTGPTPGLTNAFVRTRAGLLLELVNWGGSSDGDGEAHTTARVRGG